MTEKLLKELLELKKINNIDEVVFKRILLSIRKNNQRLQNEDVHILRTLFGSSIDDKVLELISLLLASQLIKLREVPSYLEFLPKIVASCDNNHLFNIAIAHKLFQTSQSTALKNHILTSSFLTKEEGEAEFLKDVYLFLNSMGDSKELTDQYFNQQGLNRTFIEDTTIPLAKRRDIFSLINNKAIFFNEELLGLIIKRYDMSLEAAIWTSKLLKAPKVKENSTMVKFISDEANIPLMCGVTFVALNSADISEEELRALNRTSSTKSKMQVLKKIISSHYLAKKTRTSVQDAFESALGRNYELYLKGELPEEEFLPKLSESNISPDIPRINF